MHRLAVLAYVAFALFPLYWLLTRHVAWQNALLLVFSYAFYAGLDERMPLYLAAFSLTVFAFTRLIGAAAAFCLAATTSDSAALPATNSAISSSSACK